MTRAHDFAVDLAKAGKSNKEIKEMVDKVYVASGLSISQVYRILAKVKAGENAEDRRGFITERRIRTPDMVKAVEAFVAENRRHTVNDICKGFSLTRETVGRILHDDLGLVKKSARWVPKLLSDDQKKEREQCAKEVVLEAFLMTMSVPFFTPRDQGTFKAVAFQGHPRRQRCRHQGRSNFLRLQWNDIRELRSGWHHCQCGF
jgi:methionine aminopeptidase